MKPLRLSVVGHTNTGKTSLLRTLLRDEDFGEVKNEAATTRHVEEAIIHDQDIPLVYLYDTPGLEDAGAVMDWLEENTSYREEGIDRLEMFLKSDAAASTLNQEAKVLRQLLQSDLSLYVIDAREPVSGKYKEELNILSWCAKPLVPVFNFIEKQNTTAWVEMLAKRSLHFYNSFDSVAFDFKSEIELWKTIEMVTSKKEILNRLIQIRTTLWRQINEESCHEIAHFLLDVSAYQKIIEESENPKHAINTMHQAVRQLERQLQTRLLNKYRFYHNSLAEEDLDLNSFQQDPFDEALWKEYGIRTGTGMTTGVIVGAVFDTAVLGSSLGMGTVIGGMVGSVVPNINSIGDKLAGRQRLYIDSVSITLLATRSLGLLHALQQRGHAAQKSIFIASEHVPWQVNKMPGELEKARKKESFSTLNNHPEYACRQARESTAQKLASQFTRKNFDSE